MYVIKIWQNNHEIVFIFSFPPSHPYIMDGLFEICLPVIILCILYSWGQTQYAHHFVKFIMSSQQNQYYNVHFQHVKYYWKVWQDSYGNNVF